MDTASLTFVVSNGIYMIHYITVPMLRRRLFLSGKTGVSLESYGLNGFRFLLDCEWIRRMKNLIIMIDVSTAPSLHFSHLGCKISEKPVEWLMGDHYTELLRQSESSTKECLALLVFKYAALSSCWVSSLSWSLSSSFVFHLPRAALPFFPRWVFITLVAEQI